MKKLPEEFDIVYKTNEKEYGFAAIWNGAMIAEEEFDMRIQTYQDRFGLLEILDERFFEEFLEGKSYITDIGTPEEALREFIKFWRIEDETILDRIIIVKNLEEATDKLKNNEMAIVINGKDD